MNKFWLHEKGHNVHAYECRQGMNKLWTCEKGHVIHAYQWKQGMNKLRWAVRKFIEQRIQSSVTQTSLHI